MPRASGNEQQFNTAQGREFQYTTKLFYMVHIRPKGPVPVLALEWQISNEVPNNLSALKLAAEAVTPEYVEVSRETVKRIEEVGVLCAVSLIQRVAARGREAGASVAGAGRSRLSLSRLQIPRAGVLVC